MSSEDLDRRIHQPTPKRQHDFRKRGEVGLSKDLTMVATVAGGTATMLGFAAGSGGELLDLVRVSTRGLGALEPGTALLGAGQAFAWAAAPVCVGALVGYTASGALQLGWPPAFKRPSFDLSKVWNPEAIKQLASPKEAGGRVLKATAKVAFVAFVAGLAIVFEGQRFLADPALSPPAVAARLGQITGRVALYCCLALAALAGVDLFLARRRNLARMRMTPEELKREMREMEGDPQIRRRRRLRMRELARRRLAVAVKSADVVLVNPTEYAVALRYRADEGHAPRVVAKGRGATAERIRELARKAGVPILPEPPLTRLLHKVVPEGREIPVNLYHAVAEILAYVYRLRARRPGAAPAGAGARRALPARRPSPLPEGVS